MLRGITKGVCAMYKVMKQYKYDWGGFVECFSGSLSECEKHFNELSTQGTKAKIVHIKVLFGSHEKELIKKNY